MHAPCFSKNKNATYVYMLYVHIIFVKYFSNVLFYVPRKMGYLISQQMLLIFIFLIGMVIILIFPSVKSGKGEIHKGNVGQEVFLTSVCKKQY